MLSTQQQLSCNYLTEGCNGGWAILNSFLNENGGLVSEQCAPYQAKTKDVPCSSFSTCPVIAKSSNSSILSHPSETRIQQEILRNGAVITDWNSPPYAKAYKSGVLTQKTSDNMDISLIGGKLFLLGTDSELPNHASVIIGWGEENQTKYWIVRNTFGKLFGDSGDMKVKRGEFMIESAIVTFDPVRL